MAIWQVTLKQRVLGQEVRNVLYYEGVQAELTGTELQELADDFRADFTSTTGMVGGMSNQWRLYGVGVRRVDQAGWPSLDVGFSSGDLVGTASVDPLPTQVAILLHGSAYAQKPNRVRTYLAGMTEAALTAGLVLNAEITKLLTFLAVLHSESIGGDLWKRQAVAWDLARTHVTDWNEVTNYFVSSVPATQRRRRIGRGI